jgi:hypothetical protein
MPISLKKTYSILLTIFNEDGTEAYSETWKSPVGGPHISTGFAINFDHTIGSFELQSIDAEFSLLEFKIAFLNSDYYVPIQDQYFRLNEEQILASISPVPAPPACCCSALACSD